MHAHCVSIKYFTHKGHPHARVPPSPPLLSSPSISYRIFKMPWAICSRFVFSATSAERAACSACPPPPSALAAPSLWMATTQSSPMLAADKDITHASRDAAVSTAHSMTLSSVLPPSRCTLKRKPFLSSLPALATSRAPRQTKSPFFSLCCSKAASVA